MIKTLAPQAINGSSARLNWVDDQDQTFGVHELSDGTIRAIALVTALAQPSENLPHFISIDEPELGLHPAAMAIIAGLIRAVRQRCQVVLATQSGALLDLFDADDVVVVERRPPETTLKRLDSAELSEWLADYSLSEIYDKNIIGGRP